MRNLILIVAEVIVCYFTLLILHKKYKTDGLYVYAIIATFLSCIMSLKQIDILIFAWIYDWIFLWNSIIIL